ncbi:GerMN domain-containing protein [Flavonifractor plautii]|nr:GerMN domain-containing protein [Flavonifractor plautii]
MRRRIAALGCLLALAAGAAPPPGGAGGRLLRVLLRPVRPLCPLPLDCEPFEGRRRPHPCPGGRPAVPAGDPGPRHPLPRGVRLLSWELEEGRLHLDLSEQYGGLSGVDLTVADACLTLTLCQVEGVESVYVTVEGGRSLTAASSSSVPTDCCSPTAPMCRRRSRSPVPPRPPLDKGRAGV